MLDDLTCDSRILDHRSREMRKIAFSMRDGAAKPLQSLQCCPSYPTSPRVDQGYKTISNVVQNRSISDVIPKEVLLEF
jgi:hypothetical protein